MNSNIEMLLIRPFFFYRSSKMSTMINVSDKSFTNNQNFFFIKKDEDGYLRAAEFMGNFHKEKKMFFLQFLEEGAIPCFKAKMSHLGFNDERGGDSIYLFPNKLNGTDLCVEKHPFSFETEITVVSKESWNNAYQTITIWKESIDSKDPFPQLQKLIHTHGNCAFRGQILGSIVFNIQKELTKKKVPQVLLEWEKNSIIQTWKKLQQEDFSMINPETGEMIKKVGSKDIYYPVHVE